MRTPSFLFLSLVSLASGCAAPDVEATEAQTADVIEPVWTGPEDRAHFSVSVYGSGDVPAGSECAPGEAHYSLSLVSKLLTVGKCVGAPLRLRWGSLMLDDAQAAELVAAARAVTRSTKTTCDEPASRYVTMAFHGMPGLFGSDRFACDQAGGTSTVGIERVVETFESLATPPLEPAPSRGPLPASFWPQGSTTLSAEIAGSGSMPLGSSCTPGATSYTLFDTGRRSILVSRCVPMNARFSRRTIAYRALTVDEASELDAVLGRVVVSAEGRCDSAAPYVRVNVFGYDERGRPLSTNLVGIENACALDADHGPFVDIAPLQAVLEKIAGL